MKKSNYMILIFCALMMLFGFCGLFFGGPENKILTSAWTIVNCVDAIKFATLFIFGGICFFSELIIININKIKKEN